MKPADQPGAVRYGGPGYHDLPVVRGTMDGVPCVVTAWELSADEVTEINRTGRIWLCILGSAQPPVLLSTTPVYEELA